jgi:hypothetical protein
MYFKFEKMVKNHLCAMLKRGYANYVYLFTTICGSTGMRRFFSPLYKASWSVQKELFSRGYHECGYCHWAATTAEGHELCQEQLAREQRWMW